MTPENARMIVHTIEAIGSLISCEAVFIIVTIIISARKSFARLIAASTQKNP
jgi:hypothetical protein